MPLKTKNKPPYYNVVTNLDVMTLAISVTQTSTNIPTSNKQKDDFNVTITWSRSMAGFYMGQLNKNIMAVNKTIVLTIGTGAANGYSITAYRNSASQLSIITRDLNGNAIDDVLSGTPITITVYNNN